MDIIKATPELLADYLNYLIDFSRHPIKTQQSIGETDDKSEPRVIGKLFFFLALSVGVGIVINYIGVAAGMAPDNSSSVRLLSRIDEKLLPAAILIVLVMFAVVSHVVFVAVGSVQGFLGEERFTGSIAGAVNAFAGFAAWGIPIMVACIVIIRLFAAQTSINPLMLLVIVMPLSAALLLYFVAALAAGYGIGFSRAALLFGTAVVLIVLVSNLF